MGESSKPDRIIWASWQVFEDGRVRIVATHKADGAYQRWEGVYASLSDAAHDLGAGFEAVVKRALDAGTSSGRWLP